MTTPRVVGMGAVRNWADDNELKLFKKYHGQKIKTASLFDDALVLEFSTGKLVIEDDGQSCCESRYLTCDDDVKSIVGGALIDIDVKQGPGIESDECHETTFVEVLTSAGFINFTAHNEHNGYYGGFSIRMRE